MFRNGKRFEIEIARYRSMLHRIDVYFRDVFYPTVVYKGLVRPDYQLSIIYDSKDGGYEFDRERFDSKYDFGALNDEDGREMAFAGETDCVEGVLTND